ncbi:hypothetical protein AMATHDRAFT_175176 [Amanita thiersii Skay4041]|uniref:Uncharacterized protein n=1 Tax=Amanita thiersii Skay4041 TaxID=703135 RepID=A0A2A9NLY1_9AGAR|nr:hypothetical protein AMATHDRAFT_175176 [Amanita thiersii Skay4041]
MLVNNPDKVIPPGKSLLSMLAHSRLAFDKDADTEPKSRTLHDQIREVTHRAFWDEALEVLSVPQPSVQLPRLRLLYNDLKDVLSPLLPVDHPCLQTLSSPPSPTTSPLHSSVVVLREVLLALKERCAPVRDQVIVDLLALLDGVPSPTISGTPQAMKERSYSLAQTVINVFQSTIKLSEIMKVDLNKVVMGSMSESQLRGIVASQAKSREREFILRLWSGQDKPAEQIVQEKWCIWTDQLSGGPLLDTSHTEDKWKLRLLQSLASSIPVSCSIFQWGDSTNRESLINVPSTNESPNELPPPYLFTVPTLLYIQNFIQALVITAALQSLLRMHAPMVTSLHTFNSSAHNTIALNEFVQRIWILLVNELDPESLIHHGFADVGETKIAHLADELIRTWRKITPHPMVHTEAQLRAAVEGVLRPHDPLFCLLQKRLVDAFRARLLSISNEQIQSDHKTIPEKLRTGRDVNLMMRNQPSVALSPESMEQPHRKSRSADETIPVKGFEDPVLIREINQCFSSIVTCIRWISDIWDDLV